MSAGALLLAVVLVQVDGGPFSPPPDVRAVVLAGQGYEPGDGGALLDAGSPAPYVSFSDSLYLSCPAAPPVMVVGESNRAGIASEILHGSFDRYVLSSEPRQKRIACLMATCDEDRHRRAEEMNIAPPWWWIALTSAVVVSAAAGFTIGHFTAAPTSPSP